MITYWYYKDTKSDFIKEKVRKLKLSEKNHRYICGLADIETCCKHKSKFRAITLANNNPKEFSIICPETNPKFYAQFLKNKKKWARQYIQFQKDEEEANKRAWVKNGGRL